MTNEPSVADEPQLILATVLQNPRLMDSAQVAVTIEAAAPVLNTLDFLVHNPSNNPVVPFENPDGLTPDDPLPPMTGPWVGPRLDRLYVYFPYGTTSGTLAPEQVAAAFTLSPAPGNASWDVVPATDPNLGPYWLLFPKHEYVLAPNESVGFVFAGVQTVNPAGSLTHISLKKQITGYEVETERGTNLSLVDAAPQILKFAASADTVDAGTTVDLRWETWNAKDCTLNPGDLEGLPPNEPKFPRRVVSSTNFKLQAFSASGKVSREFAPVDVAPAAIQEFVADPPDGTHVGEAVALTWRSSSAVAAEIRPNVGAVCQDADGCDVGQRVVHPNERTVYTLTVQGASNQVQKTVTVFPLPFGWQQTTGNAPWDTRDRPVLLAFDERLWFMAGGLETSTNDIYFSYDGATWPVATRAAPWEIRTFAGGAVFGPAGQEKMWLLGGAGHDTAFNDIWATDQADGRGWVRVSDGAEWSPRSRFGCIVFQGKLWLIGGLDAAGNGLRDIWNTEDGLQWTQVVEQTPFTARWSFGLAEFSGRMWLLGGQTGAPPNQVDNQLWSSLDGVEWLQQPTPPWPPRSLANGQATADALYLFGGANGETSALDDLWQMTIEVEAKKEKIVWTQRATRSQGNSAALGSTMMAGGIWLAGGWSAPNDVRGPNRKVWLYAP